MAVNGATVTARVQSEVPLKTAELNYTTDGGPWQKRVWKTAPAELKEFVVTAVLPTERPLTFYLRVTDERNLSVSTAHEELAR